MNLYGDYHTHTIYSHGKGTVDDNARVAGEKGLKQIAITDHGLGHIAFGLRMRKMPRLSREIDEASKKYGITIYKGVEANIIGLDGQIDMSPEEIDQFDIILCGYHKVVWPKTAGDFFRFFLPNYFIDFLNLKSSPERVELNTAAIINCIKRFPVDVLTHINYGLKVDCRRVARACAEYGTFIEINGKRISYTDDEMRSMLETGVRFIVNSDAHSPSRIGEISVCKELIERLNIPRERIVNLDAEPDWRSHKEKKARG